MVKLCLIFPYHPANANAISALLAAVDIHPALQDLDVFIPSSKRLDDNLPYYETYDKVILAVSVFSVQVEFYKNLIERLRVQYKDKLLVIAGGPHPTGDPKSMILNGADYVCRGEGEFVFPEFILAIKENRDLNQVPGLCYRDQERYITTDKPQPINLDNYPPFSINHDMYRPIEITRGCAWKCAFCQVRSKGGEVRHRSIESILKYVKLTKKKYQRRRTDIRFISPNALSYGSNDGKVLNLDKLKLMLRSVKDVVGDDGRVYFGSFPSEVRPETISEKTAKLLKMYSDSTSIIVGGQSGSDRLLEYSKRGHTSNETLRAVSILLSHGFEVYVDVIFGLPSETEEDVELTVQFMEKLTEMGAKIHTHTFLPLVGTPFASKPAGTVHKKYKILLPTLVGKNKVKGQHEKQEKEAKVLEQRRSREMKERKKFRR